MSRSEKAALKRAARWTKGTGSDYSRRNWPFRVPEPAYGVNEAEVRYEPAPLLAARFEQGMRHREWKQRNRPA